MSRTTDPRQFRPISLTPVVCKILDAILKEALLSNISQLSLLTTRRLLLTNLLLKKRLLVWLDKGDTVDIVYLEIVKTFDSVNLNPLLTKPKCYGIFPSAINWIESYLRQRPFK